MGLLPYVAGYRAGYKAASAADGTSGKGYDAAVSLCPLVCPVWHPPPPPPPPPPLDVAVAVAAAAAAALLVCHRSGKERFNAREPRAKRPLPSLPVPNPPKVVSLIFLSRLHAVPLRGCMHLFPHARPLFTCVDVTSPLNSTARGCRLVCLLFRTSSASSIL
jgi:hypothetical protein